jgi:hypothetical protein
MSSHAPLSQIEDILTDIFFSLPFPAGMAENSKIFLIYSNQSSLTATIDYPKNVMKNDDFCTEPNFSK